jgi:tripartite ATP-independent transporter DctM subunit
MSGSALADAAASGKLMQTMMTRDGKYPAAFAAALTCVSSVIGPIIPPSIPLVLYALVSDTSVGYLFLGGVVPGLLLGVVQSALIAAVARRRNFPVEERVPLADMPRVTWEALPALLMPVILLGCMYSGITTPTEAAAVAAAYALLVSVLLYRSVGLRDVYHSLVNSARITVSIGMLIAGALVFNYVITSENIPKTLSAALAAYQLSPLMFLIAVNVLLLVWSASWAYQRHPLATATIVSTKHPALIAPLPPMPFQSRPLPSRKRALPDCTGGSFRPARPAPARHP